MSNSTQQRSADGAVKIAVRRLAGSYPFHVAVLEQFDIRASTDVPTMGVTMRGHKVELLYNVKFVDSLPADQLGGVLLHEVHHVLLGHLQADQGQFPDRWARIVAEEVTVNEFVTEPLPRGGITLDLFPSLKPMESTDQRYRRLTKVRKRIPISTSVVIELEDETAGPVDDHSIWPSDADREARAVIRAIAHDAILQAGADQLPRTLRQALLRHGVGRIPGDAEHHLNGDCRGRLPWQRLLQRYCGQRLAPQPDFLTPPRRSPELVGIAPGKRRLRGRPRLMAVVDTSASITPQLLELINGELSRMASGYEVIVVQCDAVIQRVAAYRPIKSVLGRGGTDLRPPLTARFLKEHRPDLVVYFTDGFGPAPDDPPGVPVIWCLTPEGERPVNWGRVIEMREH